MMENSIPKVIKVDLEIIRKFNDGKYGIARYSFDKHKYEFTYYYDKPFFTSQIYLLNEYDEYIKPSHYSITVYTNKEIMLLDYGRILNSIESLLLNKKFELEESINSIREQKELLYTKGENLFK